MKIVFTKNTLVDIYTKSGEIDNVFYKKDSEAQITELHEDKKFYSATLENGDILLDIPRHSVTIVKQHIL